MIDGWIKMHRKMIDWEWFSEPMTAHLFLYILLKANHKSKKWRGIEVNKGQLITSVDGLSSATGLTRQSVRTCLKRLESTGEISRTSTNKFTLITVEKYGDYQAEQQTTNNQLTTNKNEKKYKNEKNDKNYKNEKKYKDTLASVRGSVPEELRNAVHDFEEHRQKLKAPLTATALSRILIKVNNLAGGDIELSKKILWQSVEQGWKGVFPLKEEGGGDKASFLDFLKEEA